MLKFCYKLTFSFLILLGKGAFASSFGNFTGLRGSHKTSNQLAQPTEIRAKNFNDTRNFISDQCWYQTEEDEKKNVVSCYRSSRIKKHNDPFRKFSKESDVFTADYESQFEDYDSNYGSSSMGDRIINGVNANYKTHPWVVYLEIKGPGEPDSAAQMCGGTLLSHRTVLTAKHCVNKVCVGLIKYGGADKTKSTGTVRFKCEDDYITMHEDCDLAIIKTKVRIEGRPVSIPRNESEHPNIGDYVYAVGWGRACDDPGEDCKSEDRRPNILQLVRIRVTNECLYRDSNPYIFCAGGMMGKLPKDACSGDSGGPLECIDEDGKTFQCGVVSQGPAAPDCGKRPGGYVRLASPDIMEWLEYVGSASAGPRMRTNVAMDSKRRISDSACSLESNHSYTLLIVINAIIIYRLSRNYLRIYCSRNIINSYHDWVE